MESSLTLRLGRNCNAAFLNASPGILGSQLRVSSFAPHINAFCTRKVLRRTWSYMPHCVMIPSNDTFCQQQNTTTGVALASDRKEVLLLVDHGSKRTAANDMLGEIAEMLRSKSHISVHTAHMELASPSIADGVRACVDEGASHVIVVPYFLSPGRHSMTDIPRMTEEALASHCGVTYEVRPPIGTHPGIVDIILDRAGLL